ncbi:MAG: MgtC/SapB family protein [Candidatus Aenigmarchaeota archaeon]|nr:MgtC/SapB family protein [Candidatus Aenigmarchaeota archaeon]
MSGVEFLGGFVYAFLLKVLLSMLSGFVIGVERESRGKDAGISTHTFVICGAMVFSYISTLITPTQPIAAQIVTGIGFLGAGLILKEGNKVKNLTTAASIWFAAAIGMCYGFGYYIFGIICTLVSFIAPKIPHIRPQHSDY